MFSVSKDPIDEKELRASMAHPQAGGFVCFEGWVRDHNEGQSVRSLEYEAFAELAEAEAERIIAEAQEKFQILQARAVHRVGHLAIGDMAVWVGAAAAHREEAFLACRYIIDQIKVRLPVWKKEHYVNGKAVWVNCQRCSHHHSSHVELTEEEFYSRQTKIRGLGPEGQKALKKSRVLVIGAGGLGAPALLSLAGAGVGHLTICDSDRLEVSNLHRQNIYRSDQIGEFKALAAAEILKAYNPFIQVDGRVQRADEENILDFVGAHDLVLDCTDNFRSQFLIHDACQLKQVPLVLANVHQFEGEIQCFTHKPGRPCLRCLWPEGLEEGCVGNCSDSGVLGAVTMTLGAMQAFEAIKLLLKWSDSDHEKLIVNLLSQETLRIRFDRSPDCRHCQDPSQRQDLFHKHHKTRESREWEINSSSTDLEDFLWVDIREDDERGDTDLEGQMLHIPLSQMNDLRSLSPNHKYLLVCSRGVRSRKAVEELRRENCNQFYSLVEGLSALLRGRG